MCNLPKNIFYISLSVVLILSFYKVDSHFQSVKELSIKKKKMMDEHYYNAFEVDYLMMNPGYLDGKNVKLAEENLKQHQKDAFTDGYSKCEIEMMCSDAFNGSLRIIPLKD